MDSRFMRECVTADYGFVRLHSEAHDLREHLAGWIKFLSVDAGFKRHPICTHAQGHHNLFQRSVAGALADAVDGAFDLTGPGIDCRETVSHGHSKIVVTMNADDYVFTITDDT